MPLLFHLLLGAAVTMTAIYGEGCVMTQDCLNPGNIPDYDECIPQATKRIMPPQPVGFCVIWIACIHMYISVVDAWKRMGVRDRRWHMYHRCRLSCRCMRERNLRVQGNSKYILEELEIERRTTYQSAFSCTTFVTDGWHHSRDSLRRCRDSMPRIQRCCLLYVAAKSSHG
jgi:hypothetical protein